MRSAICSAIRRPASAHWCFFNCAPCGRCVTSSYPTFATDLTRQQEAREVAKHKADTEAAKNARLADVDQRLEAAAAEADLQRRHLAAAQNEIGRLTAFWHYFKRRRRQKSLESLRNQVVVADAAVGDLHAERSAIDQRSGAGFPGYFVGGTPQHQPGHHQLRGIAVRDTSMPIGLAARAKEAVARRVHEMSFGTRADCEGYMQRVQKAQATVANVRSRSAPHSRPSWSGCARPANTATTPTRCRPPIRWRRRRRAGSRQEPEARAGRDLERAGRGLLGPLHGSVALGQAAGVVVHGVGAPRLGGCRPVQRRHRKVRGDLRRLIEQYAGGRVVLDLFQRLRRLRRRARPARRSRAPAARSPGVCVPPRAF